MNPLKEGDKEKTEGSNTYNDQIKNGHLKITVKTVVKGRKTATCHQKVDSCIVQTIEELIGF